MEEYEQLRLRHGKILRDNVYGCYVQLHPTSVAILDTPEFQRLRNLSQLGCTKYVFPGAEHSRLAHSLGVAHLAHETTKTLRSRQRWLEITPDDLLTMELAGLAHDVGHGPWSHAFEAEFLNMTLGQEWRHEQMSLDLLEYIVDKHSIDLDSSLLKQTQDIIGSGKAAPHFSYNEKPFMLQVVANKENGVDVDKIDYLRRDAMLTGIGYENDFRGLMEACRVLGGDICFKEVHAPKARMLFQTRSQMHEEVYTHAKAKAVELMLVDALIEADQDLGFTRRALSPEEFWELDESSVREEIRLMARLHPTPGLERASGLLMRLKGRQLYEFCGEVQVPHDAVAAHWKEVTEEEVLSCQDHNCGVMLVPGDIAISNLKIDFTKKDKDPLAFVKLYDACDRVYCCSDMPFQPRVFLQRKVRAFLRRWVPDPVLRRSYQLACTLALKEAMRRRYGGKVQVKGLKYDEVQQQQQLVQQAGVGLRQQMQQPTVLQVSTPQQQQGGVIGRGQALLQLRPRSLVAAFAGPAPAAVGSTPVTAAAAAGPLGNGMAGRDGMEARVGDSDEEDEELDMIPSQESAMDVMP